MKKKNSFLVKFTVVAAIIGIFSPSVSMQPTLQSSNGYSSSLPLSLNVSLFHEVEARRGGGGMRRGGGGMHRGGARARPSRSMHRNRNISHNRNINRNRNVNRNINRNVNVNRRYHGGHRRYYGGYGRGYGYYGGAPVLAFATGLALGSVIAASTMPRSCTTVVTSGISYRRCGNSYYQPFYQGDTLVYKSVNYPY
jgi:hypothetical protein